MKRTLCIVLCLLSVFVLAVPVFAAGNVGFSISASSQTLNAGDTVTLTVHASSSEPATSYGLMLSYDTSVFELVSGSCSVPGALVNSFQNGFAFMFQQPIAYSGTVGTVTLKVKATAPLGSYTISGSASANNGGTTVPAYGCSTSVSVVCNSRSIRAYGDYPAQPARKGITGKVIQEARPACTLVSTEDLNKLKEISAYSVTVDYTTATIAALDKKISENEIIQEQKDTISQLQQQIDNLERQNKEQSDTILQQGNTIHLQQQVLQQHGLDWMVQQFSQNQEQTQVQHQEHHQHHHR